MGHEDVNYHGLNVYKSLNVNFADCIHQQTVAEVNIATTKQGTATLALLAFGLEGATVCHVLGACNHSVLMRKSSTHLVGVSLAVKRNRYPLFLLA